MAFTYIWHWLTTTCAIALAVFLWRALAAHRRLLEERVERLEAENAHLRNAIYARAGVGPVLLNIAPSSGANTERKPSQPIRRPISWSQVKQRLESEATNRARGTGNAPSSSVESPLRN